MNCPYCEEFLNEGATVCKTCRRDIGLAMSLKEANRALQSRVQELEGQLAGGREPGPSEVTTPADESMAQRSGILDALAVYMALPSVALIGAHYFLVIKFDASLVWLRVVSIALPAAFGWMLESKAHLRWFTSLALGLVVAFVSVFGMSTMVHFADGVPILPNRGVALRETLEYVASIALAYLLGSLIAGGVQPTRLKGRLSSGPLTKLATFIAIHLPDKAKGKSLEERIERTVKLIKLAGSAATAIGAAYTGFKGIL